MPAMSTIWRIPTSLLIALLGMLVAPSAAHAGSKPTELGVLRYEVFGDNSEEVTQRMRPVIERALAEAGYAVRWLDDQVIRDCPRDNVCIADLGERLKLTRFARIRVETSGELGRRIGRDHA